MHELVTDETTIDAEEQREKKAGPESIHEVKLGQEHENQDARTRHENLADRKGGRPLAENGSHDRIGFDHSALDQQQRQECVRAAEQHDADR